MYTHGCQEKYPGPWKSHENRFSLYLLLPVNFSGDSFRCLRYTVDVLTLCAKTFKILFCRRVGFIVELVGIFYNYIENVYYYCFTPTQSSMLFDCLYMSRIIAGNHGYLSGEPHKDFPRLCAALCIHLCVSTCGWMQSLLDSTQSMWIYMICGVNILNVKLLVHVGPGLYK